MPQIGGIKPLAKLRCQRLCERGQQPLAVGRACFTALLKFDDMSPHFPAGLHLHHVHGTQGSLTATTNGLAQAGQQLGQARIWRAE